MEALRPNGEKHQLLREYFREMEFGKVERLLLLDFLVVLVVFVLLFEGQHFVLFQKGLTLTLKLLKVLEE